MNHTFAHLISALLILALLLPAAGLSRVALASALSTTIRISVSSSGEQGNGGSNEDAISTDGLYVAFTSGASNLIDGGTIYSPNIYVRNRQNGQTTLVSVSSSGEQGKGSSDEPSISADGRYVAFSSDASNLVSGDTNHFTDVFVRDRQTGQTTRVSVSSSGVQGNMTSWRPSISGNGRYVAFRTYASTLVNGDTNSRDDIFVHDLQTSITTRVSVSSSGVQGNNGAVGRPSMSADGRYVLFESNASNLVSGDTNDFTDVFVHDRQTGQTTRVSVSSSGVQGNDNSYSYSPSISADGRYVVFSSIASNLVSGDTNAFCDNNGDEIYDENCRDVFIHDRQTSQTTRISISSSGAQGNDGSFVSGVGLISTDGRYVVFASHANNLVSSDTNTCDWDWDGVYETCPDVFIHDRQTGQTTRVSVSSAGVQGNGYSYRASISANGRIVAFTSDSDNLVSGDTNESYDIFVARLGNGISTSAFLPVILR